MDTKEPLDAKTTEDSSESVLATAESQSAKEVSLPSQDDKEPVTPDEIIAAAAGEAPKEEDESSTSDTPEAKEDGEDKTEDSPEEVVPFHEHPRWQEKLQELQTVKTEVEVLKPQAEQFTQLNNYLQQHSITTEQFNEVIEIAGLLNNNPAKAWEKLQPIVSVLQEYSGATLPTDLQEEVDNGIITNERAKEIAKYRANETVATKRGEVSVQMQQKQAMEAIGHAINDWDQAKRVGDPTFVPKAKADAPNGLWELTKLMFNEGIRTAPDITPQGITKLLESSYTEAKRSIGAFQPVKKPMRTLSSNGTSVKSKPVIKSADDIIELAVAGSVGE